MNTVCRFNVGDKVTTGMLGYPNLRTEGVITEATGMVNLPYLVVLASPFEPGRLLWTARADDELEPA